MKCLLIPAWVLTASPLSAKSTPAPPAPANQQTRPETNDPGTTLKVNVKLVNVFATVTNANGAPVASLKREDFKLYEDGEPQKIAVFDRESELPLSIVMGIDASLS